MYATLRENPVTEKAYRWNFFAIKLASDVNDFKVKVLTFGDVVSNLVNTLSSLSPFHFEPNVLDWSQNNQKHVLIFSDNVKAKFH